MNNKVLYNRIIKNISKEVKALLEDIQIPTNNVSAAQREVDDAVKICLEQLDNEGGAYLDWGTCGDMYKNVNNKSVADEVGLRFQEKGYFVYYQGMGEGHSNINPGTPIAVRIKKIPSKLSKYDSEFDYGKF